MTALSEERLVMLSAMPFLITGQEVLSMASELLSLRSQLSDTRARAIEEVANKVNERFNPPRTKETMHAIICPPEIYEVCNFIRSLLPQKEASVSDDVIKNTIKELKEKESKEEETATYCTEYLLAVFTEVEQRRASDRKEDNLKHPEVKITRELVENMAREAGWSCLSGDFYVKGERIMFISDRSICKRIPDAREHFWWGDDPDGSFTRAKNFTPATLSILEELLNG